MPKQQQPGHQAASMAPQVDAEGFILVTGSRKQDKGAQPIATKIHNRYAVLENTTTADPLYMQKGRKEKE